MSFTQVRLRGAGSGMNAGNFVSYKDMPVLSGGEYDSQEAKRLCRVIRERLKCLDEINGTCYLNNFDESVCEGDTPEDAEKRRKLIESVAVPMCGGSMDNPVGSCMANLRAGKVAPVTRKTVRFAAGVSEMTFDDSQPVRRPHPLAAGGVRLEAVAPALFVDTLQGGLSNCATNPGYKWTPGSSGPDGMGYCPDDYEPGTVQPGFDKTLYQVSVTKGGKRVWTSAANRPITYDIHSPGFMHNWPRHAPQHWVNYGFDDRFCKAAYSFLPFDDQVAALNYLIKSNKADEAKKEEKAKGAKAADGANEEGADGATDADQAEGKAKANALLEKLRDGGMLSMVEDGKGIMFKTGQSYVGGIKTVDGVDYPSGKGIMSKGDELFVGEWGGNAQTLLGGEDGEPVFEGVGLKFEGGSLKLQSWKNVTDGSGVKNTSIAQKKSLPIQLDGVFQPEQGFNMKTIVNNSARGAVFDAGDLGVEIYRKMENGKLDDKDKSLTIAIGTLGTDSKNNPRVVSGWMNTVAADGNHPVKFKLENNKPTILDMYFGDVNKFGIPDGNGRLSSSIPEEQLKSGTFTGQAYIGRFVLGNFVLGMQEERKVTTADEEDAMKETGIRIMARGFFLNRKVYGDADFQRAVEFSMKDSEAVEAGTTAADEDVEAVQQHIIEAAKSAKASAKAAVGVGIFGAVAGLGLGAIGHTLGYGTVAVAGATVAPVAAALLVGAFIWSRRTKGTDAKTKEAIDSLVQLSTVKESTGDDEGGDDNDDDEMGGGALDGVFISTLPSGRRFLTGGEVTKIMLKVSGAGDDTGTVQLKKADGGSFATLGDVKTALHAQNDDVDFNAFEFLKKDGNVADRDDTPVSDMCRTEDGVDCVVLYRAKEADAADATVAVPASADAEVPASATTDAEAEPKASQGTGKVEPKLAEQVRMAQAALAKMSANADDTEEAKALAAMKTESDRIFMSGKLAIELEGNSFVAAADNREYMEKVRTVLTNAAKPCKTLSLYRRNPSRYVRQSAYLLTMKVLALLQYIGSSSAFDAKTIGFDPNEVIDGVFNCLKKISLACFCQIRDGAVSGQIVDQEGCDNAEYGRN